MTKITFSKPIEFEGVIYSECDITEPTVGAVEAMEIARSKGENDFSATIALCAVALGWPQDVIRKLPASDYKKMNEAYGPFIENLVGTGRTPEA